MSSQVIDSKVVEMQFDNSQFESNVKTSLSTLEKLKQSLRFDGADKGFENVSRAVSNLSFSTMADGIDSLQKRFSTFGIVAMRVVERLTDAAINFSTGTMKKVTDQIVSGGKRRAFNIENAHFQLQGLLKDEEKVQAVMDDAMTSVDGTAYAYDEAAKAASQFAASGIESGDQMQSALRGITGVAAMTNSEYEGISRIFTTVAGNGRLMGDQLLQLSSRGLNAASTLADFFNGVNDGTITTTDSVAESIKGITEGKEVVEADIREMVSDGLISFEIFSAAMDDAFGEHAKRANETFTGALSNVRAALSRIGAEFFSPLIVQNGALVKLFNALRVKLNEIHKGIKPLAGLFTDTVISISENATEFIESLDFTGFFDSFNHGVETIRNNLFSSGKVINAKDLFDLHLSETQASAFQKLLIDTAAKHGIAVDKMIEQDGSFNATIKEGWLTGDILSEAYGQLTDAQLESMGYTQEEIQTLKELKSEADDVNTPLETLITNFEKKPSGLDLIIDSVKNTFSPLASIFDAVGKAWKEVFPSNGSDALYGIIEKIHSFTEKLKLSDETLTKVKNAFKGVFSVASLVGKVFVSIGKVALPPLKAIGGALLNGASILGEWLYNLNNSITSSKIFEGVLGPLGGFIKSFVGSVASVLKKVKDWAKENKVLAKTVEFVAPYLNSFGQRVGETVEKISNWAKENQIFKRSFDFIKNSLNGGIKIIQEWFNKFRQSTLVQSALTKMSDVFTKFKENVKGFFSGEGSGVGEKGFGLDSIKKVFESIKNYFAKGNIFGGLISSFENLKASISSVKDWALEKLGLAGEGFSSLGEFVTEFAEIVKEKIGSDIDFGKVFTALTTFISFIMTFKLLKGVTNVIKIFGSIGQTINDVFASLKDLGSKVKEGLKTILQPINDLLDSFTAKNKAEAFESRAKGIRTIALAIGILAAAMYVLGRMDVKQLKQGAIAVGALMGALLAFSLLLKIGGSVEIKAGGTILAFAVSILLLIAAFKKVDKMLRSGKDLSWSLAYFGALVGMMIVALLAVDNMSSQGSIKNAVSIIAMAMAINGIVNAFKKLSKSDLSQADTVLATIGILLTELVVALRACNGINVGSGLSILAIVVSLNLLIGVMKRLAKIKASTISKSIPRFIVLLGMLATLMLTTKLAGEHAIKAGLALVFITVALNLLTFAVKTIGGMNTKSAIKGTLSLTVLMLGIAAVMKTCTASGRQAIAAWLIMSAITGVLSAMTFIVKTLSKLNSGSIVTSVGALSVLMLELVLVMKACKTAGKESIAGTASMLIIVGALFGLAEIIKILSEINGNGLATATIALSAIMAMMSMMMLFTRALKTTEKSKISIGPLLSLTLAIGVLAGSLYVVAKIDSKQLDGAVKAMVTMMAAFALLGKLSKGFGDSKNLAVSLLAMSAAIGLLAGIFYLIRDLDAANMMTQSKALSLAIVSIGGVAAALSLVHADIATGAMAGLAFDAFIAVVGSFAILLGVIDEKLGGGLAEAVLAGIPTLEAVGTAIGSFVGGIVEGFSGGKDTQLTSFGENLETFLGQITSFLDSIQGKEESFGIFESLGDAILKLTASAVLEGITSFVTGSSNIDKFAAELPILAEGLSDYAKNLDNSLTDSSKIDASTNLVAILATLYGSNDLKSGGFIQKILGESIGLDTLGSQLATLATGLSEYSRIINAADFNEEKTETSKQMLNFFATLYGSDDLKTGGLLGALLGNSIGLDTLGDQLKKLAEGLSDYSKTINDTDFNAKKTETSKQMIKFFATIYGSDDLKQGGLMGILAGDSIGLDTFGGQLKKLAEGLSDYANIISDTTFNAKKTKASKQLLKMLADIYGSEALESSGWIGKMFGGESVGLDTLGSQLSTLASGLSDYAEKLNDTEFNTKKTKASKQLLTMLADLYGSPALESSGWTGKIFGGESVGLDTFGGQLTKLAEGMGEYCKALQTANVTDDDITMSQRVIDMVTDLSDSHNMPKTNAGLIGYLTGDDSPDLSKFGKQMGDLAQGIADFSEKLGDNLDSDKIKVAGEAAKMLGELQAIVAPVSYGGDDISGPLGSFGDAMVLFGERLATFAGIEVDTDKLESLTQSASYLTNMANRMRELNTDNVAAYGDVLTEITTWAWEDLANVEVDGMSDVVEKMKEVVRLINSMERVNTEKVTAFKTALDEISGVQTSGLNTILDGAKSGLASGIGDNSKEVSGAFTSAMDSAKAAVSEQTGTFNTQGKDLMNALKDGIGSVDLSGSVLSSIESIIQAIMGKTSAFSFQGKMLMTAFKNGLGSIDAAGAASTVVNNAKSAIMGYTGSFYSQGQALMGALRNGMGNVDVSGAATSGLGDAASRVRNFGSNFRSAGENLSQGLANGIRNGRSGVVNAAADVVSAAIARAKALAQIKSPSRVMYEVGSFFSQGFVNGISSYADAAADAGGEIADSAINSVTDTISKISALVEDGVETQPTISPVLDLSNVEKGAGRMNRLLDFNPAYAMAGNVRAIHSRMSMRNQNTVSNADVVDAIYGLQRSLRDGTIGGNTTYNVNGVTYDDGSNVSSAVTQLIHAVKVERRA